MCTALLELEELEMEELDELERKGQLVRIQQELRSQITCTSHVIPVGGAAGNRCTRALRYALLCVLRVTRNLVLDAGVPVSGPLSSFCQGPYFR
jgi:hypothetical protein